MTRIETTVLLCDNPWHGRDETRAVVTRSFGVAGREYETDLCGEDSDAMTDALGPFTAAARTGKPVRRKPGRTAERRRHAANVRRWWARNQRLVPGAVQWTDRGRLPASVVAEYERRHGGGK